MYFCNFGSNAAFFSSQNSQHCIAFVLIDDKRIKLPFSSSKFVGWRLNLDNRFKSVLIVSLSMADFSIGTVYPKKAHTRTGDAIHFDRFAG